MKNSVQKTVLIKYVGAILLLVMGVNLIRSISKDGIIVGVAGFLLIMASASIVPITSRIINRKVRKTVAIASSILALALVFTTVAVQLGEDEKRNQAADKSFAKVKELLIANNIDGAVAMAKTARSQYSDSLENPAALFLKDYKSFNNDQFVSTNLMSLTDADYEKLKIGNLHKNFVQDSLLNKLFIHKLIASSSLRVQLLEKKKTEAAIKGQERAKAARQAKIEAQFSRYDGSHRNLERAIKANMNDDDSYEHVETSYADEGEYLIVTTTFKGKNAFNATVKSTVAAKVSLKGEVLEFINE